jgi:kynureninase
MPAGVYLLSHAVGCRPRHLPELEAFLQAWQSQPAGWDAWLALLEDFCDAIATLLHAAAATDVCPQTNVSAAVSKIVGALPQRRGRYVLLASELDFPSVIYVLRQAERLGYTLKLLPADGTGTSLATWTEHLTDNVQLALVTHGFYGTGALSDVAAITAQARRRGVTTVVDVAQSAGLVPIDVAAWDADFVVGSCVKWLCGGPGAGFLWANPAHVAQYEPMDVGWFSHADPFAFDARNFRYVGNARRFWGGTPSVLPFAGAIAGLRCIQELGVAAIRAHSQQLTGQLLTAAAQHGWSSPTPTAAAERGGTVVLQTAQPARLLQHLRIGDIIADARQGFGVRLSPHIYNSSADIAHTIDCLATAPGLL